MAGTRRSWYLPLSLSVSSLFHDNGPGWGCNPVHPPHPCHGIAGFQFLRHAFSSLHLFHQPLIPRLCLRLKVAQVGHQLVRKEHFHIGKALMLLQESQVQVRLSAQGAAVLRGRKIRKIVVAVQGVMDAVFQKALAQFIHVFCPPCWWRRSAAE